MEKEIQRINEMLQLCQEELKNEDKNTFATIDIYDIKAINNLLTAYKKLEKQNKYQKKLTKLAQIITDESIKEALEEFEKDYIPKSKVKEKIEELEECVKRLGNDGMELTYKESAEAQIEVLQELLREE